MKKNWFRRFIKYTLVLANVIIAILFLIGCLLPWIPAKKFWVFGFIGIAMPYLVILIFLWILFWSFVKRVFAIFNLLFLCLGYKQISVMFAWNTNDTFKKTKANYNVRIVSWNIGNMNGRTQKFGAKRHSVDEIISSLLKQNADVICLQEYEDCKNGCKSVELIKKKYPYYYFPGWVFGIHKHASGNVIFSKYPITKTDSSTFSNGENIISTSIAINEDTVTLFTTHLNSYKFSRNEFNEINEVIKEEVAPPKNLKGIINKMRKTLISHSEEAEIIAKFLDKTNHSSIFCGDLNELPNNNAYWQIRKDRQDAFLAKGSGFGKTFNSLSTILRIDYIMPDEDFEVTQFNLVDEEMSDHKMLVADLMLKKYQAEKTKN